MSLAQAAFVILAVMAVVAALGVVLSRHIVHAALSLIAALVVVAGIYLLLFAEFLALVQILIYGGAVVILLLFALMLTRAHDYDLGLDNPHRPFAVVAGLLVFGVLAYAVLGVSWGPAAQRILEPVPIEILGRSLFGYWAIPFEVASLVLLVALIGSIVIARTEEPE